MSVCCVAQEEIMIGNYHFTVNDSNRAIIPYLKFDGNKIVDIRKANEKEKLDIKKYDRLTAIGNDQRWYYVYYAMHDKTASIVPSIENNDDEVYVSGKTLLINGKAYIEFADVLVDETNAKDYLFRVIKNNNEEIVHWKTPDNFFTTKDGKYKYANLGKYEYSPNQEIKIEIYNIKDYSVQSTRSARWVEIENPTVTCSINYQKSNDLTIFSSGDLVTLSGKIEFVPRKGNVNFIDSLNSKFARIVFGDSLLNISISAYNRNLLETVCYLVRKTKEVNDTVFIGRFDKSIEINRELWKNPGKYELQFMPFSVVLRSKQAKKTGMYEKEFQNYLYTFPIEVLPEKNKKIVISQKQLIFYSIALLALGILLFLLLKQQQKRKLQRQKKETTEARLKLQSIRSQLNPHFIFNALSGIQNLMNKKETEKANQYLGTFSRLTRNVLDDSHKEMISIDNEIKLLDDYLKMEQLRFGFQYTIRADDTLEIHNVEIPSMLLQPFAENAVKHGIAHLKGNGLVKIEFKKSANDLVLSVSDNGSGFDANDSYSGMGLQLSKNRVSLLNTIYKNTPLDLQIRSSGKGTEAVITLQNWLS